MPVPIADALANLRRRWAREKSADEAAASDARERLPGLVATLHRHGAREVVLFGSLAEGRFRTGSDIDLATAGLDDRTLLRLRYDLTLDARRPVDLVALEHAPDSLAQRIREAGEPLP